MATYQVSAKLTDSCWTIVEAETMEEARAIADRRAIAEFSIDNRYPVDVSWHVEPGGTPYDLHFTE